MRSLGPQFLRDAWNPHLPVLPFALLVLVAWSLALGKRWALPAVAALGTFDGRRVETAVRDVAAFGRHRASCTDGATVVLVTADEAAREAARADGLEPIARGGTRTAAEHDRLRRARELVEARAGPVSGEELSRLVQRVPDPGLEIVLYRDGTRRCPEPSG